MHLKRNWGFKMKTYNFIEAANSGRNFKLEDDNDSYISIQTYWDTYIRGYDSSEFVGLINAKFVLEEKKVTLTESEFDRIMHERKWDNDLIEFKKELGFTNN